MRKIILSLEISIVVVALFFAFFFGVQFSKPIEKAFPSLFGIKNTSIKTDSTSKNEILKNESSKQVEPEDKSIAEIREILDKDKKEKQGEVQMEKPAVNVKEIEKMTPDEMENKNEDYDFEEFESDINENETSNGENAEEIMPIQENDVTIPANSTKEMQIDIGDEPFKIEGVKGIETDEMEVE